VLAAKVRAIFASSRFRPHPLSFVPKLTHYWQTTSAVVPIKK